MDDLSNYFLCIQNGCICLIEYLLNMDAVSSVDVLLKVDDCSNLGAFSNWMRFRIVCVIQLGCCFTKIKTDRFRKGKLVFSFGN